MRISKSGDTLVLPIPADVAVALDLKEGDQVDMKVVGDRTIEVSIKPCDVHLLTRLRAFRGRLPGDFTFDRDDANSRGGT